MLVGRLNINTIAVQLHIILYTNYIRCIKNIRSINIFNGKTFYLFITVYIELHIENTILLFIYFVNSKTLRRTFTTVVMDLNQNAIL